MVEKARQEWYETPEHVVIDVMAKGVQAEHAEVTFGERTLTASLPLGGGRVYGLELDLRNEVVPAECRYNVLSTKVEFKLKKRDGIRWGALEAPQGAAAPEAAASYPTSSGKKTNWDALARVAEKEEEEDIKNSQGDAALNALFRQIYSGGNEDVQRAMNKSFVESGGTVLSTNWSEVGKGTVEPKPPEGMVAKKYASE